MRVLFCYTPEHVRDEAVDAVLGHASAAELLDTGRDPYAYWAAISARWDGTRDLVTVEHDIQIHGRVLPEFQACRSDWCTFPYQLWPGGPVLDRGLGCARFTAALQRLVPPEAILAVPAGTCQDCQRDRRPDCWRHLDGRIASALQNAGLRGPCVHQPPVTHHKGETPCR